MTIIPDNIRLFRAHSLYNFWGQVLQANILPIKNFRNIKDLQINRDSSRSAFAVFRSAEAPDSYFQASPLWAQIL